MVGWFHASDAGHDDQGPLAALFSSSNDLTDPFPVGISIPYLVVTAYLSIPTSDHSFTLVLLSDILSILQV
jgi:hypothetical protein